MNSPLQLRKVRLRGLGGPGMSGVPSTCASATGEITDFAIDIGRALEAQKPRLDAADASPDGASFVCGDGNSPNRL